MLRTVSSARSAVQAVRPSSLAATKASQGESVLQEGVVLASAIATPSAELQAVQYTDTDPCPFNTACCSRQLSTLRISQRVEPALKINGVRRAAVAGKLFHSSAALDFCVTHNTSIIYQDASMLIFPLLFDPATTTQQLPENG